MRLRTRLMIWVDSTRSARMRLAPLRYKETYIRAALESCAQPTLYLEIGVRRGDCFRFVDADRKIGIDPVRLEQMRNLRPEERFVEVTSDDFFAGVAPAMLEPGSVSVALIDGLHEFRQIARDFLNLEPYMHPDGVIFLDDFNPRTRERAADVATGGAWNGDGWKLAPLIRTARPDLYQRTVDADEGIGVVTGFGRAARIEASARIDEAIEACKALDYSELETARADMLGLVSPRQFLRDMRQREMSQSVAMRT